MLALVAVLEAAVAAGLGIGLVPGVHPGALDGLAAGLLLSGTVFLLLMAQGHVMRRVGPVASAARRLAAPRLPAGGQSDQAAGAAPGPSRRPGGYRSKHRVSSPQDSRPAAQTRRRTPRHAAPSSVLVNRLGGFMQVKELTVAD